MKVKDNLVFQEVADEKIVVPVGTESENIGGIIKLNETGAFLWKILSKKDVTREELIDILCEEFHIERGTAKEDIDAFIKELSIMGCL